MKSDDEYKFQRTYPKPLRVRPDHRLLLLLRRDRHRALARTPCSPATTRGCSSTNFVDLLSSDPPQGGNVALTINPKAQQAAYDGLAGARRRRAGRGGRDRAEHRQDAGDGLAADVRPQQARLPRPRGGHQEVQASSTTTRPSRCSTGPSRPGCPRARRSRSSPRRPRSRRVSTTPTPQVPGGVTYQLPLTHGPTGEIDNEGRSLRRQRRRRSRSARRWSSPATPSFAQIAGEVGAEDMAKTAEALRLQPALLRRPVAAGDLGLPRRTLDKAAARPDRLRPVRGRRRPRCRWRWSPPASPTAAR